MYNRYVSPTPYCTIISFKYLLPNLRQRHLLPVAVHCHRAVVRQGKKQVSEVLLPKTLAVIATAENLNTMKQQEKAKKAQEEAEKAEAEALSKKLEGLMVKIPAKAGEGGRLFGAVTGKEVSDALSAQHGVTIPKTKLVLDEPIKSCGSYSIKAKLGYEVSGTIHVVVTEA